MLVPKSEDSFNLLVKVLSNGEPAIMACDTIYGFVGRVPDSEQRIRDIKGREETKPFLQLISDTRMLRVLGFQVPQPRWLELWPGPFTFVLEGSDDRTIAFRIPEDDRLRRLLNHLDAPLYSTSVNRAKFPPMESPAEMNAEFGSEVPVIEDSGRYSGRLPSTLVDLTVHPARILRQGAGLVPRELLE